MKPKLRSVATILLCYITKKILVFPSISAVLKQLEIKSVACCNESTIFIFDSSTTKQSLHCCLSVFEVGNSLSIEKRRGRKHVAQT